ncbi:putative RNA-directed DNA polymerase from transposon X-element, partial [Stegodyphus mimosarum]
MLNSSDLDIFNSITIPSIIAGDLNAKHISWNSRRNNQNGNFLYKYSLLNDIKIFGPNDPTRYDYHGSADVLDITITKNFQQIPYLSVHNQLNSDHLPVNLTYHSFEENSSIKTYYGLDKI